MYQLYPKHEVTGNDIPAIKRLSDGASIPFVEGNYDYLVYLKWLNGYELQGMDWVKTSDGNTPLPADE